MKLALTATPSRAQFAPILWRGPIAEAFALAREFGYDGVELHLRHAADVEAAAVLELQQKYSLGVPTLGTGMVAGEDGLTFTDPDPEVRRRAVARFHEHIRIAARLGSGVTIGLIRGRLGRGDQRASRRAWMLSCVQECCRLAAADGVTVFLEPINRYEIDDLMTLDDAAEVIQELGAANLKILADTFHMNIEERDLGASFRRHGSLLGHVHLVDSNREVPGHGHIDMMEVLRALLEVKYQGYLCFEVLPAPDARQASMDGIRTVGQMLKSLESRS